MDILKKNYRTGIVKLIINDQDDLWYLSHIIDPGDILTGKTTRKIRIGDGDNAKVTKKTMTLTIEAETIDFGTAGDTLRINGLVKEGPEDVPRDSYHTITLEEGSECTLQKVSWLSYQKQKLEDSAEKKFTYLLCLFDREDAIFAVTKKYGFEILTKIKGEVQKKDKKQQITKDFQVEILKGLETYATRLNPQHIILASPAFYKEDVAKRIIDPVVKKKLVLATCNTIDQTGLYEVMKRPELAVVLKDSRARQEQEVVDELLKEIHKVGLAAYGMEHTKIAVGAGAVHTLLVTDSLVFKSREDGTYEELDAMMKKIDSLQGTIHIISADHDGGQKLQGVGGIGALLRYKLEWN
ncbi:TPA: mRNA surveillance protein pelota [Candidatus Woesearchaeota archaeon]|nr:mRNA surveillance protein pelota [archaeon]HIJ10965.1 mRNA surveillance protein pelota [Candidatus Woesearchaeota archaeon]|tara:strand:+ start:660 stop:1718 length:1059 start_codon:yes stop_codon:yes gene_type:complete